jgi:hypothetical protein
MCFETAGSDMSKREASSLMVGVPSVSRARISRRVGSASAPKVASSAAAE